MTFKDRLDAAGQLVPKLSHYKDKPDTVILAIPRGALQMGYPLSQQLNLPLDIVVTKKIPAPGNEEYAIGAITPDGEALLNEEVVSSMHISEGYIEGVKKNLTKKIESRYKKYDQEIPSFKDKTVIIIDDGIATGFTMQAAIKYLRREGVRRIVVAVPVAAPDSAKTIKEMVDEFICLSIPPFFGAVAQFYEIFPQVEDEEAIDFLKKSRKN